MPRPLQAAIMLVAGVSVGAGRPVAQSRPLVDAAAAPIYLRLLPQIERIKAFDHHAHPALPDDPDVDAAPPPPGASPLRVRDDNPENVAAAKALFGFPFSDLGGAHAKWLVDRKVALKKQYAGPQYFNYILDRVGIETSMANRVAMADYLDPARFKWVFFVDAFMFPFDNSALAARNGDEAVYMPLQSKLLRRYEEDLGIHTLPPILSEYLAFVSRALDDNRKKGGVALTLEAAYFRTRAFDDPTVSAASAVYEKSRA